LKDSRRGDEPDIRFAMTGDTSARAQVAFAFSSTEGNGTSGHIGSSP
jgi:hypothetical protein